MFKREDDYAEVLERARALSEANACSIVDNVMDGIRNDAPEQSRWDPISNYATFLVGEKCANIKNRNRSGGGGTSFSRQHSSWRQTYFHSSSDAEFQRIKLFFFFFRRFVNLVTLSDRTTAARTINPVNETPVNVTPRVVAVREKNDNAISGMPDKSVPVHTPVRIKDNKYPTPLPKTPPNNNQQTWRTIPTAPTVTVKQEDDRLEIAWNVKCTYKTEHIESYELHYCQATNAPADVPAWEKCTDIKAGKLPIVQCLVDGRMYYFALRAVDVNGRRAPFTNNDGHLKAFVFALVCSVLILCFFLLFFFFLLITQKYWNIMLRFHFNKLF